MKINHYDDNSWLWGNTALVEIDKRFGIHDWEKGVRYGRYYLSCDLNKMKKCCLDENSLLWGKFIPPNMDLIFTQQTNELCFDKLS